MCPRTLPTLDDRASGGSFGSDVLIAFDQRPPSGSFLYGKCSSADRVGGPRVPARLRKELEGAHHYRGFEGRQQNSHAWPRSSKARHFRQSQNAVQNEAINLDSRARVFKIVIAFVQSTFFSIILFIVDGEGDVNYILFYRRSFFAF